MADEDSHSTDTSVSGEVKKVILKSILLAHTRIFTRLISIFMRSRCSYIFWFLIVGYGLLTKLQNCTKMLRNLTFVVQFTYFCIRLNKGREQQKKFSLVEKLLHKFLRNYGKPLRKFRATCGKPEDWDLVHHTLSANRAGTMFDVCERPSAAPGHLLFIPYHTRKAIRNSVNITSKNPLPTKRL